jgi:hypothetical protein
VLADVVFTTEGIVTIGALLSATTGAVVYVFRLLLAEKDTARAAAAAAATIELERAKAEGATRLKDKEDASKSYKEIAAEAVAALEKKAEERLGSALPAKIAPVVPEHSSPVSVAQQEAADLQTLRARVTAATLALGLPARTSTPPVAALEPHGEPNSVKLQPGESVVVSSEKPKDDPK